MSEVEDLREATRQAHEAMRDLKQARKEALEALEQVREVVRGEIDSMLEAEVKKALETLGAETRKYTDRSVRKILSEFDKLAEKIMGKGEDRLDRIADRARARAQAQAAIAPKCDFCSATDVPLATHLTEPFTLPATKEEKAYVDDGKWAACPACDKLIQTKDRAGLVLRSVEQIGTSTTSVRRLHKAFWDHYLGLEP